MYSQYPYSNQSLSKKDFRDLPNRPDWLFDNQRRVQIKPEYVFEYPKKVFAR